MKKISNEIEKAKRENFTRQIHDDVEEKRKNEEEEKRIKEFKSVKDELVKKYYMILKTGFGDILKLRIDDNKLLTDLSKNLDLLKVKYTTLEGKNKILHRQSMKNIEADIDSVKGELVQKYEMIIKKGFGSILKLRIDENKFLTDLSTYPDLLKVKYTTLEGKNKILHRQSMNNIEADIKSVKEKLVKKYDMIINKGFDRILQLKIDDNKKISELSTYPDLLKVKYTTLEGETKILQEQSMKNIEADIKYARQNLKKSVGKEMQKFMAGIRQRDNAEQRAKVEEIRGRILNAELGGNLQGKYIRQINQFLDGKENVNINALRQEAYGKIEEKYRILRQKLIRNIKKLDSGQKNELKARIKNAKKSSDFKRIEANVLKTRKRELSDILKEKKVENFKKTGFPKRIKNAHNMNTLETIQGQIENLKETTSSGYGGNLHSQPGGQKGKMLQAQQEQNLRRVHSAMISGPGQNGKEGKVLKGRTRKKK
jgi:hypothetical protein